MAFENKGLRRILESPGLMIGAGVGLGAALLLVWAYQRPSGDSKSEQVAFNWRTSPTSPDLKGPAERSMLAQPESGIGTGAEKRPGAAQIPSGPVGGGEVQPTGRDGVPEIADGVSVDPKLQKKGWKEELMAALGMGGGDAKAEAEKVARAEMERMRGLSESGGSLSSGAPPMPAGTMSAAPGMASGVPIAQGGPLASARGAAEPGRVYAGRTFGRAGTGGSGSSQHMLGGGLSAAGGVGAAGGASAGPAHYGSPGGTSLGAGTPVSGGGLTPGPAQTGTGGEGVHSGGGDGGGGGGGQTNPGGGSVNVTPAKPSAIEADAKKCRTQGEKYRTAVLVPLVTWEKTKLAPVRTGVNTSLNKLKALDKFVQSHEGDFAAVPNGAMLLQELHDLLSGEARTDADGHATGDLIRRMASAKRRFTAAIGNLGRVPVKCSFTTKAKVDLRTAAPAAHEEAEGALVQVMNVRDECAVTAAYIGEKLTELEASLAGLPPAQAKRLRALGARLKGDLEDAAKAIPNDLERQQEVLGKNKKKKGPLSALTKKAVAQGEKVEELYGELKGKFLSYPDVEERQSLSRNAQDAIDSSGYASSKLIDLDEKYISGSLHGRILAGRNASRTLIGLCGAAEDLEILAGQAAKKK